MKARWTALLLAAALLPLAPGATGHGTIAPDEYPKTVLMEKFTASWCGPCKISEPAVQRVEENRSGVVVVEYHYSASEPDPVDKLVVPETLPREQAYVVSNIPYMVVDGRSTKLGATSPTEALSAYLTMVDNNAKNSSAVRLVTLARVVGQELGVRVAGALVEGANTADWKVRVTVTEDNTTFSGADRWFNHTVRAYQEKAYEPALAATGMTFVFLVNAAWNWDELGVAAFLQRGAGGPVEQAARRQSHGSMDNLRAPAVAAHLAPNAPFTIGGEDRVSGQAWGLWTLERVDVRIDGGKWQAATGTDTWSFDVPLGSLAVGAHTFETRAYDGQLYSPVESIPFTVSAANTGTSTATWLLLGGLVGGGAAIGTWAFLVLRKRKGPPASPPEEGSA